MGRLSDTCDTSGEGCFCQPCVWISIFTPAHEPRSLMGTGNRGAQIWLNVHNFKHLTLKVPWGVGGWLTMTWAGSQTHVRHHCSYQSYIANMHTTMESQGMSLIPRSPQWYRNSNSMQRLPDTWDASGGPFMSALGIEQYTCIYSCPWTKGFDGLLERGDSDLAHPLHFQSSI